MQLYKIKESVKYFALIILMSELAFSQEKSQFTNYKKQKIAFIEIRDEPLKLYIEEYIESKLKTDSIFSKGLGFIVLDNISYKFRSGRPLNSGFESKENCASELKISIQLYPLFIKNHVDCINCNYFPNYFTIIKNKLVLIYENNFMGLLGKRSLNDLHTESYFDKKSEKRLIKLINKMSILDLPMDFIFTDFLVKNLTYKEYLKNNSNKNSKYIIYDFINFNADQNIFFDVESNIWRKL